MMMQVAIMLPGDASFRMTSAAPAEMVAIWRISRSEREAEAMPRDTTTPRSMREAEPTCANCQRRASGGSMPMASMASAWRTVLATSANTLADASFASAMGRRVSASVSAFMVRSSSAEPTAIQP